MVVRIRWQLPPLRRSARSGRVALLAASLLTPSALIAFSMSFWIIASDLRWTGDFFMTSGLFSHWQIWLGLAAVLLLLSRLLDHYARQGRELSADLTDLFER